jgi:hypothetical protein
MTTETKPDNTTEITETTENQATSNKAVFGPLGKYAVVAVIMVSVIVTTAIMLNKELSTVEGKIVSIEDTVADTTSADAGSAVSETATTESVEVAKDNVATAPVQAVPAKVSPVETAITAETKEAAAVAETSAASVIADTAPAAKSDIATYESSIQARQAQLASENQARIAAHKLEQKQHMSEMFARIKTLEAQQLDQYKSHQDSQVERLREQIAIQQQMIDTLISRNKELYELRAANVQQQQTKREEMINRI